MRISQYTESQIGNILRKAETELPLKVSWHQNWTTKAYFNIKIGKCSGIDIRIHRHRTILAGKNTYLKLMYSNQNLTSSVQGIIKIYLSYCDSGGR